MSKLPANLATLFGKPLAASAGVYPSQRFEKLVIVLTALVLLAAINFGIVSRERLLADGRVVLLELAPVDPRSLMQGDYMALRYKLANEALRNFRTAPARKLEDGFIVAAVDGKGVARFRRFADRVAPAPLAADEVLLRYRVRDGRPKFATDAYFFQEGSAGRYGQARYGEFRVSKEGEMILTGMRGADFSAL